MRRWAYRVRPLPMRSRGSTTSSPCSITPTGTRATRRPKRSCRRLTLPTPYGLPTQDLFFLLLHVRTITAAFSPSTSQQVLKDEDKRRQYDQFGSAAFDGSGGGGFEGFDPNDIPVDMRDIFEGIFSGFGGGGGRVRFFFYSSSELFLSCDTFVVDTHHLVVPPTTEG